MHDTSTAYEPLLNDEPDLVLATPLSRLGAYCIDVLLAVLIVFAAVPFLAMGDDSPIFLLGMLILVGGLVGLVVYQIRLMALEGQTIGKRYLDLRIVDVDDFSNPGFARTVVLRSWLTAILGAIPFFQLADALFIFTDDHRCIHDHIASTIVIDEKHGALAVSPDLF